MTGEFDHRQGVDLPDAFAFGFNQDLFLQDFICLVSPAHPRIGAVLSLGEYQAEAHIGIVSDRRSRSGRWSVIHNIGQGAREEDALQLHPLTGRYRFLLA